MEEVYNGEANDVQQARGESGSRIYQLVDSGQVEGFTPFWINDISQNAKTLMLEGQWNEESHSIEGINEVIVYTGVSPTFRSCEKYG